MDDEIFKQVAKENNLPITKVKEIYKDWIHYIINKIESTDYSRYNNQPSFVLPYLGRIKCEEYRLNKINSIKNGRIKTKENTTES